MDETPISNATDDLRPIAGYFNADESTQAPKLTAIAQYLRGDSKDMDEIDLLQGLRNMMFKLGNPPLGSSALDHAYNYAKIDRQIQALEGERNKYVK